MLSYTRFEHNLQALGIACFAVFAFTDTSISSTLVYLLYRSRTGFDRYFRVRVGDNAGVDVPAIRSDSILTTLIRLTVSANILTTYVAAVFVILTLIRPSSLGYAP